MYSPCVRGESAGDPHDHTSEYCTSIPGRRHGFRAKGRRHCFDGRDILHFYVTFLVFCNHKLSRNIRMVWNISARRNRGYIWWRGVTVSLRSAPATVEMVLSFIPSLSKTNIVLASASPRRAELLQQIGLQFTVKPSNFDETLPKSSFESSISYTIETARQKALDIARQDSAADLIISADTSETKRFRI